MDENLIKIFITLSSLALESLLEGVGWIGSGQDYGLRTGADGIEGGEPVGAMLQETVMQFLDVLDQPAMKLLPDFASPTLSMVIYAAFPLLLIFTLYAGVMLWATSSVQRVDHLHSTISELNAKADQITQGISALAQIYIDNPPGYRRSQGHQQSGGR
ncbi:uncharacterized protein [Penaeus vannamei]|uniref:uncharacterized protein n=1 Tax=Penaeus vannamei TaxID=6689 RepID=UPI00387F86A9